MADVDGIAELRARLAAIAGTKTYMGLVAALAVREAKLLVPRKTGNLGRTIRVGRVTPQDAEVLAGGRQKVGYAAAVEYGTKPHIIRPRTKRVLSWMSGRGQRFSVAGRTYIDRSRAKRKRVFAKQVRHPGTAPHPYLRPGVERALEKADIKDKIVRAWNDAA